MLGIGDMVHVESKYLGIVSGVADDSYCVKCNDGVLRHEPEVNLGLFCSAKDTVEQMRGAIIYGAKNK